VRRVLDLIQPGERQQVLHQHTHPCRLLLDPAHRLRGLLGPACGAQAKQLGVPADGHQGRAQLVRCVGQEAAQALLARLALGEGLLQAVEHRVQRAAQPPHLRSRVGVLHAMGEVAARDRAGRARHPVQGQQAHAHHEPGGHAQQHQDGAHHQGLHHEQPVQRLVGLAQRHGHHRRARARGIGRGHDPVGGGARAHGHGVVELQVRRKPRPAGRGLPVGEHHVAEHPSARRAALAVGAGGEPHVGPPAPAGSSTVGVPVVVGDGRAHALIPELVGHGGGRLAHLLVGAVGQERTLLGVGHRGEEHQSGSRQHHDGGDQPGTERAHHARGWRSAYPTPRTVWISDGPCTSSFLRR
jgi:hypothetical protein